MPPQRIGLFGGTFDPIHIGHLILAEEARAQLALNCVYFIPAAAPPHKQHRQLSPAEDRVRMAELATAEADYFRVSRVDVDRPGPHYTAETIQLMRQQVGPAAQLFFLMGLDSLRDLPTWREPAWLLEHCTLVVLNRPGVEVDWSHLEAALPGLRNRVLLLEMPPLEIASHLLQARVRSGKPIRHQTPRAVEAYIHKHGLYRE